MTGPAVSRASARGAIFGTLVSALLLVLLAVLLLNTTGANVKVLVAVWLWAWPVLGAGFALGWLAGRVFGGGRSATEEAQS